MLTYEQVIPGLFQTEDYARAIIKGTGPGIDPEVLEERVEVRLTRQGVLTKERPLEVGAVLDEACHPAHGGRPGSHARPAFPPAGAGGTAQRHSPGAPVQRWGEPRHDAGAVHHLDVREPGRPGRRVCRRRQ